MTHTCNWGPTCQYHKRNSSAYEHPSPFRDRVCLFSSAGAVLAARQLTRQGVRSEESSNPRCGENEGGGHGRGAPSSGEVPGCLQ